MHIVRELIDVQEQYKNRFRLSLIIVKLQADVAKAFDLVYQIRDLYRTHKEAADWST